MRLRLLPITLFLASAIRAELPPVGADVLPVQVAHQPVRADERPIRIAEGPFPGSDAGMLDAAPPAVVPDSAFPPAVNRADANLPIILDVWKHRVDVNGGVHAWSRRHDGMRVWQEWIAMLTLARSASPEVRRQTGLALQKYVVGGNIRPNGFVGTSLPVPGYEDGDFDMSLLGCTSLLGLFAGDRDLLTDTTMVHLIKNVMRIWGQTPKASFDVVFVSVPETENHLFMTESSRYIANQLIWENTRRLPQLDALRETLAGRGVVIDNRQGDLKRLLLKVMQQAMCKGFFEFNAQIYQRFTVHALDNLYTFAHDEAIREGAGCLLDYLSTVFAFQSYDAIRYGPFRRSSEVYEDSSLIGNDAVCSFFGLQSGALAANAVGKKGLWHVYSTHSSMALFSAVLDYRIPEPILWYMQNRGVEYRAEIRSAYAGNGSRKRPTEVYTGSGSFLLTAGGRYESYAGPNFPTTGFWFDKAPWVYDVITRSGSLILDPRKDRPKVLKDILHFRGPQWRANNMAIHRSFLYGYASSEIYNSTEWPQHVPAGWKWDGRTYPTRDFDFRFFDRSDAGVYVILSRLRPAKTYLNWSYQKYLRGGIEVVDTAKAGSIEALREKTIAANSAKGHWPLGPHRFTYVDYSGTAIHLNSRYDGKTDGITRVEEPPAAPEAASGHAVVTPFSFPWMEGSGEGGHASVLAGFLGRNDPEPPLFQADLFAPWKGRAALSDGQGNMYVFSPATGAYCLANFREWWNPRRKIHGPAQAP
jgi:hypothetical protein